MPHEIAQVAGIIERARITADVAKREDQAIVEYQRRVLGEITGQKL